MRPLTVLILLAFPALAEELVETKHYRLHCEGTRAKAEEYGKILDAAYAQFETFFRAKPKLEKGEKLVLRVDERAPDSAEVLKRFPLSTNATYSPGSRIAYAHREHSEYTSRVHLLRAAATQFHWLARMRNKRPAARWWEMGLAEYFAQHTWDGKTLTLGVKPLVSFPLDHPSRARAQSKDFDLFGFVEATVHAEERAMSWALCGFLVTGNQGKPLKGYEKWARKMDGGNRPLALFKRTFGRDRTIRDRFVQWLDGQEPPLEQLGGEWHGIGPESVRAIAQAPAACRVKDARTVLEATLVVPHKGRWLAGVLLHYTDRNDYSVALLDWGGFLRIQRRVGGRWQTIERGPGPPKGKDGNYRLQAFLKKGKVYLMIGTDGYGPWDLPGDVLGLAIDNCDVRFRDITWK